MNVIAACLHPAAGHSFLLLRERKDRSVAVAASLARAMPMNVAVLPAVTRSFTTLRRMLIAPRRSSTVRLTLLAPLPKLHRSLTLPYLRSRSSLPHPLALSTVRPAPLARLAKLLHSSLRLPYLPAQSSLTHPPALSIMRRAPLTPSPNLHPPPIPPSLQAHSSLTHPPARMDLSSLHPPRRL